MTKHVNASRFTATKAPCFKGFDNGMQSLNIDQLFNHSSQVTFTGFIISAYLAIGVTTTSQSAM